MALHRFPPTAEPAEVSDHLRRFGYAIADDVADPARLDRLEAEAMPYIEASAAGRDDHDGHFTRRTGALVARYRSGLRLVPGPFDGGLSEGG